MLFYGGLGACSHMKFLEFRTLEIASPGCRLTAALFGGSSLRQTATRGQLAMMLHTLFRSSHVHVPTLSRAALNYECKVARAHAKVALAHAQVCRGLATPLMVVFLDPNLTEQ